MSAQRQNLNTLTLIKTALADNRSVRADDLFDAIKLAAEEIGSRNPEFSEYTEKFAAFAAVTLVAMQNNLGVEIHDDKTALTRGAVRIFYDEKGGALKKLEDDYGVTYAPVSIYGIPTAIQRIKPTEMDRKQVRRYINLMIDAAKTGENFVPMSPEENQSERIRKSEIFQEMARDIRHQSDVKASVIWSVPIRMMAAIVKLNPKTNSL